MVSDCKSGFSSGLYLGDGIAVFFQHTGCIVVYFRSVPVPCYCLTTGCYDYRCSDTTAESLLINHGGMAAVNAASLVIEEGDVKAYRPDAWSMVNRASHSMLKLKSPCQILGLEGVVWSINSSSIGTISCSGPPLFLSLQPRFLYLCKQDLTRKPFPEWFLEVRDLLQQTAKYSVSVPQCPASSCRVPHNLPIHLLNNCSGNALGAV